MNYPTASLLAASLEISYAIPISSSEVVKNMRVMRDRLDSGAELEALILMEEKHYKRVAPLPTWDVEEADFAHEVEAPESVFRTTSDFGTRFLRMPAAQGRSTLEHSNITEYLQSDLPQISSRQPLWDPLYNKVVQYDFLSWYWTRHGTLDGRKGYDRSR